ncbi:hypothetical protein BJX64DRAFT_263282 [Aspergillus heterothallicus]
MHPNSSVGFNFTSLDFINPWTGIIIAVTVAISYIVIYQARKPEYQETSQSRLARSNRAKKPSILDLNIR